MSEAKVTTTQEATQEIWPPVLDGPWPVGSVKFFTDDKLKFLTEQLEHFQGIFEVTSFFFGKIGDFDRMYIVYDPDHVQHILQKNNKNYYKGRAYDQLKPLLGNGLLTNKGESWIKQRRLMQPAFHRERLTSFANIMTEECQAILDRWKLLPEGSTINLSKDMMEMTLKIICRTMFTADVATQVDRVNDEFHIANEALIERITNPFKLPLWIPTSGNIQEKGAYDAIKSIVEEVIDKRRASGERYDDLLAMLMEAKDEDTGEMMDDEQLRDEVVTMFLAGHETTGVALTWLFHCLDENPEAAEKLLQEESNVLNGRTPEAIDVRTLSYTKMVIDETLRLYPPAWLISRQTYEDDMLGEYITPKATNCMIPVYAIHRDGRFWDEPLKFKPERFSPENSKGRHKYAYFPFGGGPRLCIGNNFALMEMQLIVPMILREFKLQKPVGFQFIKDPLITMRPEPEMQMVVTNRDRT